MSDKIVKLDPEVRTLARPQAGPLIAARHNIQRSPEARATFLRAKEEKWTSDQLTEALVPVLTERVDGDPPAIAQVARYLADEYLQIGDGVLLIDPETGKAIIRLTDDDIWQPPDVPREGGRMAKPLPRIRPDLEGLIVEWVFNKSKENTLANTLAQRLNQTDLLREEGDSRLLPVTMSGRKRVTEALQEILPTILPSRQPAGIAPFLSHFEFSSDTEGLEPLLRCVGVAKSVVPIKDARGFNLRHDHFTSISARIATQWARDIARTIALQAKKHKQPQKISYSNFDPGIFSTTSTWVADPNMAGCLSTAKKPVFYVEGVPLTGLFGGVGNIEIDEASYECRAREYHAKWEVVAKFTYTVWVNWAYIQSFDLEDVPVTGMSVEVL